MSEVMIPMKTINKSCNIGYVHDRHSSVVALIEQDGTREAVLWRCAGTLEGRRMLHIADATTDTIRSGAPLCRHEYAGHDGPCEPKPWEPRDIVKHPEADPVRRGPGPY